MILKTSKNIEVITERNPIGVGGEGSVYLICNPKTFAKKLAKIIHTRRRNSELKRKLTYLCNSEKKENRYNNFKICWIEELLFENNEFAGVIIEPAFKKSVQLYELLFYSKRKSNLGSEWILKYGDELNLLNRIKICLNIAAAIHFIHSHKSFVIVDLKPQNILVDSSGRISIIDCDSFQIYSNGELIFPSMYTTPEYTPPEGRMYDLNKDLIPTNWDYFSMAVIFYEILVGIHPFSAASGGKYAQSNTIYSKIKNGLYIHGDKRKYLTSIPPIHQNYHKLPNDIKRLFSLTFEEGLENPKKRASAKTWGETLYKEAILFKEKPAENNG